MTRHNAFSESVLNALRHQRFGHKLGAWWIDGFKTVLNALRHQRFGHLLLVLECSFRQPVLNALRHQRFGHGFFLGFPISLLRAQRLTASEVWAQELDRFWLSKTNDVLNALRHQRFGHCLPLPLPSRSCRVLNALRHQRFGHDQPSGKDK